MKLKATQIIGLAATVVFGGILAWTILKPERDPMVLPSGVDLRTLPSPSIVPQPVAEPEPAEPAPDQLTIGSQDARDDLYCSGVVFAVRNDSGDPLSEEAQHRRDLVIALAEAGVSRLIAEGAATPATTAPIADAQSRAALDDHERQDWRIPVADCLARAEALAAD